MGLCGPPRLPDPRLSAPPGVAIIPSPSTRSQTWWAWGLKDRAFQGLGFTGDEPSVGGPAGWSKCSATVDV